MEEEIRKGKEGMKKKREEGGREMRRQGKKKRKKLPEKVLFGLISLFNVISNSMSYLIPKQSL